MDHVSGMDRHQMMMTSLDQLVGPQSFARIIDAFVQAMDLDQLGFTNARLNTQGRPPYHPGDLLRLYLYGYQNGIRSCRKLQQATQVNIEVVWLLKGTRPHYKTIANFRRDNAKAIRHTFRHFVTVLHGWRLVKGRHIAIDSFKVRAQNSLKNNFNQAKLDRHFDYIDRQIDNYMEQLEDTDDEGGQAAVQDRIDQQAQRWNDYCELEQQLLDSGQDQLSTTDPDARAVVLHRNIVNVGYNVQAASDGENKLIVALDTGAVNDTHALGGMVEQVQQNLSSKKGKKMKVLADKGYHTGAQLTACEALGVTTFVSPRANAANRRFGGFPMEDFRYHAPSDTYRCPAGQLLRSNGQTYWRNTKKGGKSGVPFKQYKTGACVECPLKSQCTASARGRIVQRSAYQAAVDRNNRRVRRAPDYYRLRQQFIEHQFGTIKRQWGFTHTLMRGKENVLAEASMVFTAYNLRRSLSILGFDGLIKRLKTLFFAFLWLTCTVVRPGGVYLLQRQPPLGSRWAPSTFHSMIY